MLQIVFYVPECHVAVVKQAMFDQGAGKIGDYDCCAWQCLGQGQCRPNENCKPFYGKTNELASRAEYRVEMVCEKHLLKKVLAALRQTHPYEKPVYLVSEILSYE